jgi:hypothetical protein
MTSINDVSMLIDVKDETLTCLPIKSMVLMTTVQIGTSSERIDCRTTLTIRSSDRCHRRARLMNMIDMFNDRSFVHERDTRHEIDVIRTIR